jgi:hypothetical protein
VVCFQFAVQKSGECLTSTKPMVKHSGLNSQQTNGGRHHVEYWHSLLQHGLLGQYPLSSSCECWGQGHRATAHPRKLHETCPTIFPPMPVVSLPFFFFDKMSPQTSCSEQKDGPHFHYPFHSLQSGCFNSASRQPVCSLCVLSLPLLCFPCVPPVPSCARCMLRVHLLCCTHP